jgi:hypothetical protein
MNLVFVNASYGLMPHSRPHIHDVDTCANHLPLSLDTEDVGSFFPYMGFQAHTFKNILTTHFRSKFSRHQGEKSFVLKRGYNFQVCDPVYAFFSKLGQTRFRAADYLAASR